jgi:hypothetical protein
MDLTILVGLMGVLTVTAVYFWLLRKPSQEPEAK